MQSVLLYTGILVIFFRMTQCEKTGGIQGSDVPVVPNGMFFLGTVNGKLYFSEANVYRTWEEAKTQCESNGMDMATIRNSAESDFLATIADFENFYGGFWLGGRDARAVRQFSWDKSGDAVEDNLVTFIDNFYPTLTCLYYEGIYHNYYEGRPCINGAQTLCEFRGSL